MSTQETNLAAIASAIRQKDGSTGSIRALDFAARILAIPTVGGGGSDFAVPLKVTADVGALITAVNGGESVTATVGAGGEVTLTLTAPGTWTVTGSLDGKEQNVQVVVEEGYEAAFNLASRLPAGYTELEYIQSSGSQYIDTGIKPTVTIKLTLDIEPLVAATSTQVNMWGASLSSGTVKYFYILGFTTAGIRITTGSTTASAAYKILSTNTTLRRMTIVEDSVNKKAYIVGEAEVALTNVYASTSMTTIKLLAGATGGQRITAKLYSFRMEIGGSLVRDFVPCKNPAGTVGLYDMVTAAFYANNGTGAFIAGPAI